MKPEEMRVAIALACGYKGCTDSKCDYRKAQHLHDAAGRVCFPEPYSTSRYPDYLSDLNACAEMEKALGPNAFNYVRSLEEVVAKAGGWEVRKQQMDDAVVFATAKQRCEAFLRTIGKWTT